MPLPVPETIHFLDRYSPNDKYNILLWRLGFLEHVDNSHDNVSDIDYKEISLYQIIQSLENTYLTYYSKNNPEYYHGQSEIYIRRHVYFKNMPRDFEGAQLYHGINGCPGNLRRVDDIT